MRGYGGQITGIGEVFGQKACQPPSRVALVSPRVSTITVDTLIPGIENAAWGATVNIAQEPLKTEPTRFLCTWTRGCFAFWIIGCLVRELFSDVIPKDGSCQF